METVKAKMARMRGILRVTEGVTLSIATLGFIGFLLANVLALAPIGTKFGFKNTTIQVSNKFETQVTPAGFTFGIWSVIFLWQSAWLLFAWTYQCRPEAVRTISTSTYVGFSLGSVINIFWLFLFSNELINWSCGFLVGFDVVTYVTIALFVRTYNSTSSAASKLDDLLSRILVLNGLALYATWTTIAALINFSIVLQYTYEWDPSTVGTVTLSLLAGVIVLYFTQENTIMRPHSNSVFTVYPVIIWALIGVLAKHWDVPGEERTAIYALVLLLGTVALVFVRGALFVIFFHFRKPRLQPTEKKVPIKSAELL